jgi:predicted class III extradiol MEMO1 family dioxygenase
MDKLEKIKNEISQYDKSQYDKLKLKARYLDIKPINLNGQNLFLVSDPYKISNDFIVNPIVVLVLSLLNGNNSLSDIKSTIFRLTGIIPTDDELYNLIKFFEDNLFLLNDKFNNAYKNEIENLRKKGFLRGSLMGIIYPDDPAKAEEFLFNNNTDNNLNSSNLNIDEISNQIIALIIPHMDLKVARETYFRAYKLLLNNLVKNTRDIENVFILGVSHYYHKNPISLFPLDFETPFGILKTNKELIEKINNNLREILGSEYFDLFEDILIYKSEHSIEAQIPYIKLLETKLYENKVNKVNKVNELNKELNVIPMIISYGNIELFNKIIDSFLSEIDINRTIFISSIDLSHVGKKFGDNNSFDPEKFDQKYIELLSNLDINNLFYFDNISRIDGIFTNTFLVSILKKISKLNNFEISSKLIDYKKYEEKLTDSIVSYCSIVYFKK